ncbi:type III restriction enzyme [Oceanotoga teriensis]|uniref:Type III restriction enzyme n=1 Tax=Oceanotoga teriensis TaxID=515440 RepID=A0AA45C6J1_9BACT|nr:DEAD/DEAH box helicase family protein [Oceanotoga teriensis]PWJ92145.1 type III restriction enzyme [Oceanotoga teriensis]
MANTIKYENLKVIDVKSKAFDYGIVKPEIPEYISNNLKYRFFDWQKNAFENFLTYQAIKERENPNEPTHLMFNMATGTGKTLLMASTILHYYKQGYRHFLFFVNQNNIVDKTENNFIDNTHTKYLFKEKIVIDDKTIAIKKVDAFSDNPQGIEIKFTSIQKLYNDIHIQKENQTTLDDLHSKNIVMLADEAHHLNADTKSKNVNQKELIPIEITNRTGDAEIEKKGWEHTIIELILKKNGKQEDNKNVLLEFTATIPATESIAKKYEDKIIYKFGLKEFLQAGYTKEINLISSTLNKKERVLQALLFQWYRHKIALKYDIANFKPVVLFRSKTIEESKSDYEEFLNWIDNISSSDFDFLKNIVDKIYQTKKTTLYEMGKSRTETLLEFIKKENINFSEIANWIKQNYQEKNTIITNSKTNKTKKEKTDEETEKLLNSLEDKNNHIRAIFTVDRLTEGWDVLNLFDIVRLYQGQNAGGSSKKTPEATTKEKQLIGRGVRYFPFSYKDKIKNKRKFDDDLKHELRVLEELYYYTYDEDSRYISHLKEELRKDGYIRDDKIVKTFDLKEEFKNSDFYNNVKIWYNKQIDNPNRKKKTLEDIKKDFFGSYKIKGLEFTEQEFNFKKQEDSQRINLQDKRSKTILKKFKYIEKHIVQKAINIKAKQENSLFQFDNLKEELDINSIEDLQKDDFLGDFDIKIIVNQNTMYDDIDNRDKLDLVLKFLENIFTELKENITPKIGSEFIAGNFKKFFVEPKTKTIEEDAGSERISEELKNENWYVLDSFHGTSEEKELIVFIKDTIGNLEQKYDEIYLLRNEEVYKIYDFEQGRGFQPDFLLFLKTKDRKNVGIAKTEIFYQIFIESKGSQFIGKSDLFKSGKEYWKEEFLNKITKKYGFNNIIKEENPNYRLIGLPFFNKENNSDFNRGYEELLAIQNNFK